MKKYIYYLITILMISCNSTNSIANKTKNEKGFIAGTFTIIDEKPRFNVYMLDYKPEGKKINWMSNYHKILVKTNGMGFKIKFSPDYSAGNKKVFLFIKEHKVGKYEFFNYELYTNLGFSQSTLKSKTEFLIPFNVKKDSINYIGDFTFFPKSNENGKLFEISDKFDRDLFKFKEKYPEKNWNSIQNNTLKKGNLNESLIEFK